jgi:hypothetical protein
MTSRPDQSAQGGGQAASILKNNRQKVILFAETGINRWYSATVAGAILRRLRRLDPAASVRINKFDVMVIDRMAEVLRTGRSFPNPFMSLASDLSSLEVEARRILAVFEGV